MNQTDQRVCLDRRAPPTITFAERCDTFAAAVGYATMAMAVLYLVFSILVHTTGAN